MYYPAPNSYLSAGVAASRVFSDAGQSYRVLEANSEPSQLGSRARSSDNSKFGFEVDLGGQYIHTRINPYHEYCIRGYGWGNDRADKLLKDMFPNPLTASINDDHQLEPATIQILWTPGDENLREIPIDTTGPTGETPDSYHTPPESVWVDSTYG